MIFCQSTEKQNRVATVATLELCRKFFGACLNLGVILSILSCFCVMYD